MTFEAIGADGAQSYKARMTPLGDAPGYMLIFEDSEARIAPEAARPLVYDFDLLETAGDAAFEDCPLRDLCFVVFDTETTGLLPHKDEVVQIGAVRVLRRAHRRGRGARPAGRSRHPDPAGLDQGPQGLERDGRRQAGDRRGRAQPSTSSPATR